ncbi:MAG: 2-oxoglutarate oxidoreductase, partial [Chloroflexi bacterium]|nr:2-oxoglutarate oxidoreductase [Chloroflexota bacterium]
MSETKVKIFGRPPSMELTPERCPGCGYGIITRIIGELLDEMGIADNFVGVGGVGCCGGVFRPLKVDSFSPQAHGHSPSFATGVKRAHYGDIILMTSQGDGDTMAIGPGSLINAAARGELITILMTNNMNYGTTGGQMAPTTLVGQVTTTTPQGRDPKVHGWPIHTAELMAHVKGVAYSARGSVHNPANVTRTKRYFKTAL